MSSSFNKS